MQKISGPTANGSNEFQSGTVVASGWLNTIQRELVGLLTRIGIVADPADDGQLGQALQLHVSTIAALRALPMPVVTTGRSVVVTVRGYSADGDGGEGRFYWDPASVVADDGGITIRPSTNPPTGRWVRHYKARDVSLHWFGIPNGTDDTLLFRAAVAACPAGGVVSCQPNNTYNIKYQNDGKCVEITKGITIDFRGANLVYKPWSDSDPAGTHSPCFYFHGSAGTSYVLNPATGYGQTVTTTTAADAGNFAAGDVVRIGTSGIQQAWNYPDGLYNTFGSPGELRVVESANASTGVITLDGPLDNLYPTTATIQKMTMLVNAGVRNVGSVIETPPGTANTKPLSESCGHFISMNRCIGPVIENILNAQNFRMFCVWSSQNIGPKVHNVNGKTDGTYISLGGHSYLIRHQECRGSVTWGNTSDNVRHLLDYTFSYDGKSWANTARRGETAFITHGFGSRRIHSLADSALDSNGGWSFGDNAFGADYDGSIIDFTYAGHMDGIGVCSKSENVEIVRPRITFTGSSSNVPIRITGGAKKVRIKGGTIDVTQCTDTNANGITARGGVDQGYASHQIASATANAGTNPVVSVTTTDNHGWLVGQVIYLGLWDTANSEYEGSWTIASVPAANQFTFVRTGTTTQNLSVGSSPFRPVWANGNMQELQDIEIDGVLIKGHANQTAAIDVGAKGRVRVENCVYESQSGAQYFIRFSDYFVRTNPTHITIQGNTAIGEIQKFLEIERPPSVKFAFDGNTSDGYLDTFFSCAVPSWVSTSWYAGISITRNRGIGNSPSGSGFTSLAVWDAVKAGAWCQGNSYPVTANVINAHNKNWEFGSFTPTIQGASTAGTAGYTTQNGHYELNGRALDVRLRLNCNSFTGTGTMQIAGLPYANSGVVCPCAVAEVNSLAYSGLIHPSWTNSVIQLRQNNAGTLQDIPADSGFDISLAVSLPLTGA